MSDEKRYSVWAHVDVAIKSGPKYETWHEAKAITEDPVLHMWRIWDHATNPPTDVTDADPEAEDNGTITTTWWAVGDRFNDPNDMYWEESREAAVASTFAYGRGDSRAYKVDVTATVISDPSAESEAPEFGAICTAIANKYPPRSHKQQGYAPPLWDMIDIEDLARDVLDAARAAGKGGEG